MKGNRIIGGIWILAIAGILAYFAREHRPFLQFGLLPTWAIIFAFLIAIILAAGLILSPSEGEA